MRALPGVFAVAALLAVACGGDGEPDHPTESARPELTAEDIAVELDKLSPSDEDERPGYRSTVVERTVHSDGAEEETMTEEVVLGGDSYTRGPGSVETLVLNGQVYSRTDPAGKWRTPEDFGFDFSPLDDYFAKVDDALETTPSHFFENTEGERLPDEFLDGRHALVIMVSLDEFP